MSAAKPPTATASSDEGIDAWFTPWRVGIGLAIALAALFPDIALGTGSFYFKDYGVLGYPVIQHHHDRFWSGDFIPFWNAHSNCGAPFMAQWGTMTLYPFSLFHLLLPLPWSLGMFCLLHLWFGGMGMYRLAASRQGTGFPAAIAACIFVFNGFTLSCLQWPNYTVALGWLPWVALTVERACRDGGRAMVIAALAGTMQMLSGVPEFMVMTWATIVALLTVEALSHGSGLAPLPTLRRCSAVILLISGLSAIQLLPFFELLSLSQRHSHFTTEKWAMPWHGVANLLVPLFHYAKTYTGDFFQQGQSLLASYYTGIAALSLGAWGAFRCRAPRARVLAVIAGFSLVLAMGENGYLYLGLKKLAPQLGFARYPVKFLMLLTFALPLLAAQGVDWLRSQAVTEPGRLARKLALWWVGAALAMLLIWWFMRAQPAPYDQPAETLKNAFWRAVFLAAFLGVILPAVKRAAARERLRFQFIALAILTLDVATHLPHWNPRIGAVEFTPGIAAEAHEFGAEAPRTGVSRVMLSPAAERIFLLSTITNATMDFQGKRLAFWSNLNLLDDIPKLNGSSTLQLREQAAIQRLVYGTNQFDATDLADFLAVSHETSHEMATQWRRRASPSPWIAAGRTPRIASIDESLSLISSGNADLRSEVLLTFEDESPPQLPPGGAAEIEELRFLPDLIEFRIRAKNPTLVTLAQSHHPGWTAEVNGRRQPVWRANHAFQALSVPAGESTVRMEYRDRGFAPGAIASLLTAAICGGLWLGTGKRKGGVSRDDPHNEKTTAGNSGNSPS